MSAPAPARTRSATAFATVVAAFVITMLGTTMPTPLYSFYQEEWGFGIATVTVIFAMYAVGVLGALLAFGRWSDVVGRRPLLLAGLVAAVISDIVFLLAADTTVLIIGRLISGLSAGVYVGTATAAVLENAPASWRSRAPLTASTANMAGLGLGPVVAGAVAAATGAPLTAPYWLHLVLAVLVAVVLLAVVPETVTRTPGARLSFQRPDVPPTIRRTFLGAATAGFAGFAVLGFLMAVSPKLVAEAVSAPGPFAVGAIASTIFAASVVAQLLLRDLAPRVATNLGIGLLIAGIVLLVVAIQTHALAALLVATVVAGAGQGLSFSKGLASLLARVEAHERAGVSSAFFVVAYVAISVPVIGEGLAAHAWGLTPSATVFALLVGALAVVALGILLSDQRRGAEV